MAIISPVRLYKDIDLSFSSHPQTGDVVKKLDINSVKQSLKLLLFTNEGERPFRNSTGVFSSLKNLLFEPVDTITTFEIKSTIENIIETYEPRIELQDLQIVPDDANNHYEITIFFDIKGVNTPASFSTILTRTR